MRKEPNTAKESTKSMGSIVQEATRLLDKWARLAQSHIATGGGCSRGGSHVNLRVQDFEQDILDHLYAKYAADEEVASLLRKRAGNDSGAGSVSDLLRAVAEESPLSCAGGRQQLFADLARSLDSFEQLHHGH